MYAQLIATIRADSVARYAIHFLKLPASSTRYVDCLFIHCPNSSTLIIIRAQFPSTVLWHLATSIRQMPWIMDNFAASLPDHLRKTVMSRLCRLAARAPLEAAEAYLNIRPYKERPGHVYTHLRPNWEILGADATDDDELDYVDLKVGQAHNLELRMENYEVDCVDEPILWAYSYQTSRPKLIERLTHLTLWAMDAKRVSYPCHSCNVRHREHFSEAKSGGLEVVAAIIEYWLGRIGEYPVGLHDPHTNLRVKGKHTGSRVDLHVWIIVSVLKLEGLHG
ncbi:hypothetical protein DFH06DRAFT_1123586 [Mycena polygramma]|nr:hypothetical protein DFH06DRAFT_1123586 [Mycena polygramma]